MSRNTRLGAVRVTQYLQAWAPCPNASLDNHFGGIRTLAPCTPAPPAQGGPMAARTTRSRFWGGYRPQTPEPGPPVPPRQGAAPRRPPAMPEDYLLGKG